MAHYVPQPGEKPPEDRIYVSEKLRPLIEKWREENPGHFLVGLVDRIVWWRSGPDQPPSERKEDGKS